MGSHAGLIRCFGPQADRPNPPNPGETFESQDELRRHTFASVVGIGAGRGQPGAAVEELAVCHAADHPVVVGGDVDDLPEDQVVEYPEHVVLRSRGYTTESRNRIPVPKGRPTGGPHACHLLLDRGLGGPAMKDLARD